MNALGNVLNAQPMIGQCGCKDAKSAQSQMPGGPRPDS